MKNEKETGEKIRGILEKNNPNVNTFLVNFLETLTKFKQQISSIKMRKIVTRVQEATDFHRQESASFLSSEYSLRKYEVIMCLLFLKKDLQLLADR